MSGRMAFEYELFAVHKLTRAAPARPLHFKCIPRFEWWIYNTDGNFIRYTWGNSAGQEEWTTGLNYEIKSVEPVCLSENSNAQ
jgi:hypothetical protein